MNAARSIVLAALRRLRGGLLEVSEAGRSHLFGPQDSSLKARLVVRDASAWRRFLRGSNGLADAYIRGEWECDDLVALVRIGARDVPRIDGVRRVALPAKRLVARVPRNSVRAARRHIAAHYDLGNDLFRAFLDETMTYSCARFDLPGLTLEDAQEAKLERACRTLALTPDDHLLEIGTGWGSLAIHAARRYGCRVTTATISREQARLARRRVHDAGLEGLVKVVLEDYRHLRGRFDKLVSLEMIEAVGWQYFDTFFRACARLLEPRGLMLLQAITIDGRFYDLEKATRSFANTYVFPSGCLPSLEVIRRCALSAGLAERWEDDLTDSYPPTLRHWRQRFNAARPALARLGYDERFARLWNLYLSWCEAGFLERRIEDHQLLFSRLKILSDRTSSSTAGPREASFASAVRPPGPST